MKIPRLVALGPWQSALTALLFLPVLANAYDYPTLDRVEYVLACVSSKPDKPTQEMIYKCSCALDLIRKKIPHQKFVDLTTAEKSRHIAGDRSMRDSDNVRSQAKKFRDLEARAYKECYLD